jgi:hypothetical protein
MIGRGTVALGCRIWDSVMPILIEIKSPSSVQIVACTLNAIHSEPWFNGVLPSAICYC